MRTSVMNALVKCLVASIVVLAVACGTQGGKSDAKYAGNDPEKALLLPSLGISGIIFVQRPMALLDNLPKDPVFFDLFNVGIEKDELYMSLRRPNEDAKRLSFSVVSCGKSGDGTYDCEYAGDSGNIKIKVRQQSAQGDPELYDVYIDGSWIGRDSIQGKVKQFMCSPANPWECN